MIADAIGRARMADELEVSPKMVSKAVVEGKFPSSWWLVMKALCADADLECPPELFRLKQVKDDAA